MNTVKNITKIFALTILLAIITTAPAVFAQNDKSYSKSVPSEIWQKTDESNLPSRRALSSNAKYLIYKVNQSALKNILAEAPLELTENAQQKNVILEIPTPDGNLIHFRLEESPILAPEVAAQYPTWKTYSGQGIEDQSVTARFDINANGFHGYVMSANGTFLIDPYSLTDKKNFIIYYKGALTENPLNFICDFNGSKSKKDFFSLAAPSAFENGTTLRRYRIAVSATKEYTNFFGGSQTTAFAAIQTTVNRMSAIYKRELAVTFTLVSDTRTVFTNTNNGGFPPADDENVAGASLTRNQTVLDTTYTSANYDIGHVLSRTGNPNGLATSPSLCDNADKAQGFTGAPTPQGDGFDVDYVAHEIGHQFGMSHTFNNDIDGSCKTRDPGSAFEPASGVTIMGYAGICTPRNLSANSIEYFNLRSFDQALNYLQNTVATNFPTCGTNTPTNNAPPSVTVPAATYNIPKQTPFTLTAAGTDANNDTLTYLWEEFDNNPNGATGSVPNPMPSPSPTPGGNPPRNNTAVDTDEDGIQRPIFRAYNPTAQGTRTFPSLYYILNSANTPPLTYQGVLPFAPSPTAAGYVCASGETCVTGERLPSISRTMNFRVTVRDNNANGGGIKDATTSVVVSSTAGPFQITSQNTSAPTIVWQGNSTQTVTWDVNNTNAAPINASNVNILLSFDGGVTFPTTLKSNTPNDGSETITVPNVASTTVRIKVEAAGNIFFDINNANISITALPVKSRADFDGDGRTDLSVFRPSSATWFIDRSTAGFIGIQFGAQNDVITPGDFDGDGKADISVYRNGFWYRINSSNNSFQAVQFGLATDIPVVGDYDGDQKADIAVWRPSDGNWYRLNSSNGQFVAQQFGLNGDIPVNGDFNGDGKRDLAVFRPSNGTWYVARQTGTPAQNFDAYPFGVSGDIPVAADYDGDNKDDITVFRPSNGFWYRLNSSNNQFAAVQFGISTDVPVPGDYDGDGKSDLAVYRNGVWYLSRSTTGFAAINFGVAEDKPVPNSYLR